VPALLIDLISDPAFGLALRGPAPATDAAIGWVHNSDLDDPTPFLVPGTMLLTTGRQFADGAPPEFTTHYIDRLVAAGIVALGFGTEVVREGTPDQLVRSCAAAGLPLVEIPYRTPFIAIGRWVAEIQAADTRARVDWALAAQNSVSLAALGAGGLSAAAERAATELACTIEIFDPDGEVVISHGSATASRDDFSAEVAKLLRARRRARSVVAGADETATVLTLGSSSHLRGAMVLRRTAPFDAFETSVATTLTALAEVSLEHSQDLRTSLRSLMTELFVLLRDGQVDAVRTAIEAIPAGLPRRRFVVVALDISNAATGIRDSIERRAAVAGNRLFVVGNDGELTLLIEPRTWSALRDVVQASGARAGVSSAIGWDQLASGLVQAARALGRSKPGEVTGFSDLVKTSFFGLLSSASVAEVAVARLSPLLATAEGTELLGEAAEWLRQNGQWDPAARVLGLHRHTLKSRISSLEKQLDLRLDTFQDRAELWALLAAANLAPGRGGIG
jgi:purine catabolism regulator